MPCFLHKIFENLNVSEPKTALSFGALPFFIFFLLLLLSCALTLLNSIFPAWGCFKLILIIEVFNSNPLCETFLVVQGFYKVFQGF